MSLHEVTVLYCDEPTCGKDSRTRAVNAYTVEVNGERWEIELCAGEHDALMAQLAAQLNRSGRLLTKPRRNGMGRRRIPLKLIEAPPAPPPTPTPKPTPPPKPAGELVEGVRVSGPVELRASANREPAEWRTCMVCTPHRVLKNRSTRDQHLRTQHGITGKQHDTLHKVKFECPFCDFSASRYAKWSYHADSVGHRP